MTSATVIIFDENSGQLFQPFFKSVPDPDLEISWGGGGVVVSKKYFSTLWASVWSKNKGSPGGSATENSFLLKMPEHSNT